MTELEIEKSLKRHEDIVDEVACIEKTLLKRRSELREADRLLAEAEHELSCTKEKVSLVWFRLGLLCDTATTAACPRLQGKRMRALSRSGHLGQ